MPPPPPLVPWCPPYGSTTQEKFYDPRKILTPPKNVSLLKSHDYLRLVFEIPTLDQHYLAMKVLFNLSFFEDRKKPADTRKVTVTLDVGGTANDGV